jgi:predicted dehydrogenase
VKFCQIGSGRHALGYHGRGLPTLLEKPPGLDVAEIDHLIAAATRTGAPHLVAFNRRFVPLVRELARRLAALGGPEAVHHLRYEMVRDAPGRLEHLASGSLAEDLPGGDAAEFERGGFYGEYLAFFEAIEAGRAPEPGLVASRQSVEIAEALRARKSGYQARR